MEKEELELVLRKIRGRLLGIVRSFALPAGVEAEDDTNLLGYTVAKFH